MRRAVLDRRHDPGEPSIHVGDPDNDTYRGPEHPAVLERRPRPETDVLDAPVPDVTDSTNELDAVRRNLAQAAAVVGGATRTAGPPSTEEETLSLLRRANAKARDAWKDLLAMQGDCALTEASYKLVSAARTLEHVLKKVEADIANAHSVDELLLRRQSVLRAERGRNEREAEKLERQKRTLANAARETEKSRRGLEREREALQKERTRSRAGLEHEAAREREAVEQEMAREREAIKQELARLREDILREERGVPPPCSFF